MSDEIKIKKLQKKITILERMIEDNSREIFENQRQLEEQQAQLLYNSKLASIGEMASSIAHEINNPIGILEGQIRRLEFFLDKGDKEKQLELTEKMKQNTERVIKIIKGLRQLSKTSEKEEVRTLNLKIFLDDFQEYNHVKTIDSSVEITYPEVDEKIFIMGKETALAQILTNLVNNSLDAVGSVEGSWVKIEFENQSDGKACLRVMDSGNGIDESNVTKLFNPFYTTKSHEKGTGVGLNICKKLSQEIGGDLRYDLHEGYTSFLIDLKIA